MFKKLFLSLILAGVMFAQTPGVGNIQQIAQTLANTLQTMATNANTAAVGQYNACTSFYTNQYGTQPNASAPALASVCPAPFLTLVNSAQVIANEENPNYLTVDWSNIYSYVQYVPIPTAPVPTFPSVTIGSAYPYAPGFFYAASGDSSAVLAGTVITYQGHQYKKSFVGFGTGIWQQIS